MEENVSPEQHISDEKNNETPEQQPGVADAASAVVEAYNTAVKSGDTNRTQEIAQKLESNPDMADAVARQVEQRKMQEIKDELNLALGPASRLLTELSQARNLHALNPEQANRLRIELTQLKRAADNSTTVEDLASKMRQFNDWYPQSLLPAMSKTMNAVLGYYSGRPPQEIDREVGILRGVNGRIGEVYNSALRLRSNKQNSNQK